MRTSSSRRNWTPPSGTLLSGLGLGVAGLLMVLAGCDLREVAGPNPIAIPNGPAARDEAAPILLGTHSTAIQVAGEPSAVTTLQPAQLALPIPANSYVLLRVSGRVQLVTGPWWPGPPRQVATYTAVQTTEATGRAQTRVWIRSGTATEPPAGGYEPRFAPAPNREDRIVLVRTGNVPAELWAGRDMGGHRITATYGWCTGTPWCHPDEVVTGGSWADRKEIEAYHVVESNTVTAMLIPKPLQVDAPESFAPGQPATMSVQVSDGMRLRHPQIVSVDTADVEWRWFPGDTAGVRNPAISAQRLACKTKECTFTPSAPGRMIVATWVEGAYVEASEIVGVQTPALKLTCGTITGENVQVSYTRGELFDCAASITPRVSWRVLGWTFAGGGVTVPSADQPPQTYTNWPGEVVQSGVVTVRAEVGGRELSATATVTVNARNWVDRIAEPRIVYHGCPVVELDALTCQVVSPPAFFSDLGHFNPGPQTEPLWGQILGGPNQGFGFFLGAESFLDVRDPWIVLNKVLQQPEHDFWKERPECNVAELHENVILHERVHYTGLKEWIESQPTRGWIESFTAFGTREEVRGAMRAKLADFYDSMHQAGDFQHSKQIFRDIQYCYGTVDLPYGSSEKALRPGR